MLPMAKKIRPTVTDAGARSSARVVEPRPGADAETVAPSARWGAGDLRAAFCAACLIASFWTAAASSSETVGKRAVPPTVRADGGSLVSGNGPSPRLWGGELDGRASRGPGGEETKPRGRGDTEVPPSSTVS